MIVKSVLLGFLGMVLATAVVAQESRSVPLQSDISHVQPMTGIVLWSDNDNAFKHPEAISLE